MIEAVLGAENSLKDFISHNDDGELMATWAFACRYRLKPIMEKLEEEIQSSPQQMARGLDTALSYTASLPSSSAHLAVTSLTRMLHNTSKSLVKLASGLQTDGEKVLDLVRDGYETDEIADRYAQLLEEAKSVGTDTGSN
jgi:hypothetical protein